VKVLALIDSSHYAVSVCDHAAWAAIALAAPIELLHVLERHRSDARIAADRSGRLGIDTRETLLAQIVELDERRNRLAHKSGRHLLDEAAARVRRGGIEGVTQRLVHGTLIDSLREHEHDAALVVLGKEGEGAGDAGSHLGSNLERVVRGSHRPVLVTSQSFRPVQRFLLAFDGGASTGCAIDFLVNHPILNDAEGHLLMVGEGTESHRYQLEDATARLQASGLSVSHHLRSGDPERVIPQAMKELEANLLVMGAFGHSRIRNLVVGSTTTALLATSTVPLLIVR
jgi:nucleotide-binding universal stress UspA family protein